MFSLLGLRRELASIVFLFQSRSLLSGQFVGFMQVSQMNLGGIYRELLPLCGCFASDPSADGDTSNSTAQQQKVNDNPKC